MEINFFEAKHHLDVISHGLGVVNLVSQCRAKVHEICVEEIFRLTNLGCPNHAEYKSR